MAIPSLSDSAPNPQEIWVPVAVPGYEKLYEVSNLGRVRSLSRKYHPGKLKKPDQQSRRYPAVHLYNRGQNRGQQKAIRIDWLVLLSFVDSSPLSGQEPAHLNNNPADNRLSNLYWEMRHDVANLHRSIPGEVWRPVAIPRFEKLYEVSDQGRVRSLPSGRCPGKILKSWTKSYGHHVISLWKNNKVKYLLVHRLVLLTFIGPPPTPKHEAAHNNGISGDNRLCNLRWATSSENTEDTRKHGTMRVGSQHPNAHLTEDQVRQIRFLGKSGMTPMMISKQFNVCRQGIGKILRGKIWKHVE